MSNQNNVSTLPYESEPAADSTQTSAPPPPKSKMSKDLATSDDIPCSDCTQKDIIIAHLSQELEKVTTRFMKFKKQQEKGKQNTKRVDKFFAEHGETIFFLFNKSHKLTDITKFLNNKIKNKEDRVSRTTISKFIKSGGVR